MPTPDVVRRQKPALAPSKRILFILLLAAAYFLIWLPGSAALAGWMVEPLVRQSAPETLVVDREGSTVGLFAEDGTREMRFRIHGKWLFFGVFLMLAFGHTTLRSYLIYLLLHIILEAFPLLLLASELLSMALLHEIQVPLQRYLIPAISFGYVAFVCFPPAPKHPRP